MIAKLFKQTSLVVMMTTALSACGAFSTLDEVVPDNTQKYRRAETMPPLDVPPELSRNRINDNVAGERNTAATYTEFEEAASNPLAAKYNVTPDRKPALAGEGANRHLVVPGERDVTWQRIQDFWVGKGLSINRIDSRIGLMDTSPDADNYSYRVRMERGDTSRMSLLYLSSVDESRRNVQKDEATLRELADHLGGLYQQDTAQMRVVTPTVAPQEETARVLLMDEASGNQYLLIEQAYQTVWLRVGRVLDSKGFSVEERDRARGHYFIRYIDPFQEIEQKQGGLFSKMAFWRDDVAKNPEEFFYIKLLSDGSDTTIRILDAKEQRTSSDTAKRLLNLLQEQLAP